MPTKRTAHDAGFGGGRGNGHCSKGCRGSGGRGGRGGSGGRGGYGGHDNGIAAESKDVIIYLRTGATVRHPGGTVSYDAPPRTQIVLASKGHGAASYVIAGDGIVYVNTRGEHELPYGTTVIQAPSMLECPEGSRIEMLGQRLPGIELPRGTIIDLAPKTPTTILPGRTKTISEGGALYNSDYTLPSDFQLPADRGLTIPWDKTVIVGIGGLVLGDVSLDVVSGIVFPSPVVFGSDYIIKTASYTLPWNCINPDGLIGSTGQTFENVDSLPAKST